MLVYLNFNPQTDYWNQLLSGNIQAIASKSFPYHRLSLNGNVESIATPKTSLSSSIIRGLWVSTVALWAVGKENCSQLLLEFVLLLYFVFLRNGLLLDETMELILCIFVLLAPSTFLR